MVHIPGIIIGFGAWIGTIVVVDHHHQIFAVDGSAVMSYILNYRRHSFCTVVIVVFVRDADPEIVDKMVVNSILWRRVLR